ncbi:MAG: EscU/YscU/HrcU family type III secretion system export apparatus switch protein [Pseudomonadota bacterium]
MSEKTEEGTQKKQRDARKKGQVAKTADLGATFGLLFTAIAVMATWNMMMEDMQVAYSTAIMAIQLPFREALSIMSQLSIDLLIFISLPIIGATIIGGLVAHHMQVGFLFSFESAKPSLENLSPKKWFKKVISVKALVEITKTVIKVYLLSHILFFTIKDFIPSLLKAAPLGVEIQFALFCKLFFILILKCVFVFGIVAAVDYFIALRMHKKELMMSKDEVKREYKEMEGDPLVKSQRRQLQIEMAQSTTLQETRKATALIVNPTHIAVAIRYEAEQMPLPMVVGIGHGAMAKKMREIAEEEGIPIMRNIDLARSLAHDCKEFDYIPAELIDQVVDVLQWVYEITGGR